MPKGSAYPGSPKHLAAYAAMIERHGDAELKGAKNPYTSRNGWMVSFLDPDGRFCFRLAENDREDLLGAGGAHVQQYGKNMPDFSSAPSTFTDAELDRWFATSWRHAGTLDPK